MDTDSTDSYTTSSPFILIINTDNGSNDGPVDYHYLGNGFNGSIMTINFVLATIAITLNFAVMSFYKSTRKETIPFMYLTLSTSDLLTGISGALHSIIFFSLLLIGPANSSALFYIAIVAYFITVVSFRVSAFVSLVFAVIRTLRIVYPLHVLNRLAVILAIVTQFVIWLAVLVTESLLVINVNAGIGDLIRSRLADFFVGFFYSPSNPKFVGFIFNWESEETRLKVNCGLSLLYTGVSVTFLGLLAFVAMVIQVKYLVQSKMGSVGGTEDNRSERAVTIILITLVFVVCSTLVLFQPLFVDCSDVVKFATTMEVRYMLQYSFGYLPFFLNAALNPLILVARVEPIRSYVLSFGRSADHLQLQTTDGAQSDASKTLLQKKESELEMVSI